MADRVSERGEDKGVPGLAERMAHAVEQWALARGHRGITAFAKSSGIPQSSLDEYLKGQTMPSALVVMRVATTAGVSADHLIFGRDEDAAASPVEHVRALLATLRSLPGVSELANRDHQRRFRDLVSYVGTQLRRCVFDVEMLLGELRARERGEQFEADEHRRRLLNREDEP